MLASAGACAWYSGLADLLFGHCRRLSDLGPLSVYRPWVAAQYASVLGGCPPAQELSCLAGQIHHPCPFGGLQLKPKVSSGPATPAQRDCGYATLPARTKVACLTQSSRVQMNPYTHTKAPAACCRQAAGRAPSATCWRRRR